MQNRKIYLVFFSLIALYSFSQKELRVNGKPLSTNECAAIIILDPMPNAQTGLRCDIRDAQIVGDCIEITVMYGGCNGNLELYTDNKISNQSDSNLNFRLIWQEPSFCKSLTLIKVSFDLKPYKTLIKDKSAMIRLLDANFELYYSN